MSQKKIVAYRLLYADQQVLLNEDINMMIGKGWQPFGSPQIVMTNDPTEEYPLIESYYQAVVKYKN